MVGAALLILVTYGPGIGLLGRQVVCDPGIAPAPDTAGQSAGGASGAPSGGAGCPAGAAVAGESGGNPSSWRNWRALWRNRVLMRRPPVPGTVQAVLTARWIAYQAPLSACSRPQRRPGKEVALPLLQAVTDVSEEAHTQ